jgi:hypothetical protein
MVKALEVILLITIFEGVDGGTSVALVVAAAVLLTADILPAASSINCKIIRRARSKTINSVICRITYSINQTSISINKIISYTNSIGGSCPK